MKDSSNTPPPWRELLQDFTQETTLHGIRFPTTKHTHNARRIIWTLVILGATITLLIIIFNNLVKYFERPKSVNVDVTYKPELPFPAVTLCNQNLFKSTGIFQEGMHDVLNDFFKASDNSGECKETYTYEKDNCPSIDTLKLDGKLHHLYVKISFQVCSSMCSDAHSATCTHVLYDRQHKSCLLTSGTPDAVSSSCHTSPYELYKRHRCIGRGRELMTCDLEGAGTKDFDTGCKLIIDRQSEEVWSIMKMKDVPNKRIDFNLLIDHTFGSRLGQVLVLGKTINRPSFRSLLSVEHRLYDRMCMEFWYIQMAVEEKNHVHFKVILSKEHLHQKVLLDSALDLEVNQYMWNKVFLHLPDGKYSLKITTVRPAEQANIMESGLMLDDISIWPCERYDRECIWAADDTSYHGLREYTLDNQLCAPWSDVAINLNWTSKLTPKQKRVAEQFISSSGRFCRVPPHFLKPDVYRAGCYKMLKEDEHSYSTFTHCIQRPFFCPCRKDQFHCENSGLCIPDRLTCNGERDCPEPDASDEGPETCGAKRNLACSFEELYMCGYTSSWNYPIQWRRKQAGDKLNEEIDVSYTHNLSSLQYILDIDSSTSNEGDRALLMSPEWTITEPAFCITFWYHMAYHDLDTEEMLKVYVTTNTWDTIPLLTIRETNSKKEWKLASAPLPLGTFNLMFEATIGFSYRSDISLDDIEVQKCSTPLLTPVRKRRSIQSNISCTFNSPGLCGYELSGTSPFANWAKVPNVTVTPDGDLSSTDSKAPCETDFVATRGTFQSPKFPQFYAKQRCTNTFKAPESSTVTVTFQKIHVSSLEPGMEECHEDKITVTGALQVSLPNATDVPDNNTEDMMSRTEICGYQKNPDLVFVSSGREMSVIFTALTVSTWYEGFRAKYEMSEPPSGSAAVDYVMMVDRSLAGRGHQEVHLTSPHIEPLPTASCLQLKVYGGPVLITGLQNNKNKIPILYTNVEVADWTTLQLKVPERVEQIVFTSWAHKAAIDDIFYDSKGCTAPVIEMTDQNLNCTFMNDDCGYKDTFEHPGKWLRTVRKERAETEAYSYDAGVYDFEPAQFDYIGESKSDYVGDYYYDYYEESVNKRQKRAVRGTVPRRSLKADEKVENIDSEGVEQRTQRVKQIQKRNQKVRTQKDIELTASKARRVKREANDGDSKEVRRYVLACGNENVDEYPCQLQSPWIFSKTCLEVTMRAELNVYFNIKTELKNGEPYDVGGEYRPYDFWEWRIFYFPLQADGTRVVLTTKETLAKMIEIGSLKVTSQDCYDYATGDDSGTNTVVYVGEDENEFTNGYEQETGSGDTTDLPNSATGDESGTYTVEYVGEDENEFTNGYEQETGSDDTTDFPTDVTEEGGSHRVVRQADDSVQYGKYENTTGNDEIILSNTVLNTRKPVEAEITIGDLYQATKHELDDLIFSCTWKNKPCDMSWFTQEATELGICHTFNFNTTDPMRTDLTGSFNGLSLVLNVEKYDHTTGINSDAGIKLHLHDQNEVPSVSETGLAVALSTHTLIEMRYSKSISLGDPYGDCGEIFLDYYPDMNYTYARCQRQCKTKQLEAQCSCRDAYMPDTSDEPVCTLDKYLNCALRFYTSNSTGIPYECQKCPDACEVVNFATEMSFASLSELSALELINDRSKNKVLQKRFYTAREVMARSDPTYVVVTMNQLENVIQQLHYTLQYTESRVSSSNESFSSFAIEAVSTIVELFKQDTFVTFENIDTILGDYDISYGMAVADLMGETRRLSHIMSNTVDLLMEQVGKEANISESLNFDKLEDLIAKIKDDDPKIKYRRGIYKMVPRRLDKGPKEKEDTEVMTQRLVERVEEYIDLVSNFSHTNQNNSMNPAIVTKSALDRIAHKYKEFTQLSTELRVHLGSYATMLEDLDHWLRTDDYIFGRVSQITSELETRLSVELLQRDLETELVAFQDLYKKFAINDIDLHNLTTYINDDLSQRMDSSLDLFQEELLDEYLGKMSEAVEEINMEVVDAYSTVLDYFTRLHIHFEPQSSPTFEDDARLMGIWRMPYTQRNAIESLQYRFRKHERSILWPKARDLTSFTLNKGAHTVLKYIMSHYFETVTNEFSDFEKKIKAYITTLKGDIKSLVQNMNAFRLGSVIDAKFVVENFLKLDVYYGELKYEFIEQTPSYDAIAFFSDMGGYMGLLLGASVMTVCEIFDLILYQSIMKLIAAGKRSKKVDPNVINVEACPDRK